MEAQTKKVVEAAVLSAAQQMEAALDDEIEALDTLDDQELEDLRRKRLAELKREADERKEWVRMGHGNLGRITEKEFFEEVKKEERMVALFARSGSSRISAEVEEWLGRVAQAHWECRFVVLDAEKSPFLCGRLGIRVLPSILVSKAAKTVKLMHGLDEINPSGRFSAQLFEEKFFELGVLNNTSIADRENDAKDEETGLSTVYRARSLASAIR